MSAFRKLVDGMVQGKSWSLMGDKESVRQLLWNVYDERCNKQAHYRNRFQLRTYLDASEDAAAYAGWIVADNPSSGAYQGTSFVWMPSEKGSLAVLVIGTDGFGADTAILGRPGHARRLRALSRIHHGRIWVKPDVLDISSEVPSQTTEHWPDISACLKRYSTVIYAAIPILSSEDADAAADLLDLFFWEHDIPLKGAYRKRWDKRIGDIVGEVFPKVTEQEVLDILLDRRYVILEGPPGTGKTRLAYKIADTIGSSTRIQFHGARTYEDFVVGLFPQPTREGLSFDVRAGDLLMANREAAQQRHLLVVDEINRADLARVLGEAVTLFEVGEADRSIRLPHVPPDFPAELTLNPDFLLLGTRNTADRSVSRMDVAIRRRFAFLEVWPSPIPVEEEGIDLAIELFRDTMHTFSEYADADTLRLVPGHAYFLDPRPDLPEPDRTKRVERRIKYELLPLLRDYLAEKLCGAASEQIAALADRIEARLMAPGS